MRLFLLSGLRERELPVGGREGEGREERDVSEKEGKGRGRGTEHVRQIKCVFC